MLNLILEFFLHNPKLCTYYQHWTHNYNKTMNFLYISTNRTCVLDLMWRGDPNQWEGFFIIPTFAMESPSFFFFNT
jgi:hypothetical protein